jgi:hypothetical protein
VSHAASEIRCAFFKGLVKTSIRHLLRLIIPISSFTSVNASLISKFSVSTHMLKCRLLKSYRFAQKEEPDPQEILEAPLLLIELGRRSFRLRGATMRTRRAIDVKKEVARSANLGFIETLFSTNPTKSAAILPKERLASEGQALLNETAAVIECATGGHGRCLNRGCGCRCHHSRLCVRSNRRIGN